MARTSDPSPSIPAVKTRRLGGALLRNLAGAGGLFMPPVCLHCEGRRWRGTPLCLSCLRHLDRLTGPVCARCGLPDCAEDHGAWVHPFSSTRFLFKVTPELTTVVHGFKYRHMRRHIAFLGAYLRYRPDLQDHIRGFDALLPVPLHAVRRRERGYNQAEEIATSMGRMTGVPVLAKELRRIRETGTQTALGRDGRQRNLGGAFACPSPERLRGKRILLVDDVYTTGATAAACAEALRKAGCAEIGVVALGIVKADTAGDDFVKEMEALAGYLV